MDVLDFAMQMELDGKAHYERLEEMTPVAGLKKVFSILAADEEKHYEVMEELKKGIIVEMAASSALETAKNIFQSIRLEEGILADLKTKIDAYRYAIKIEADSISLYEGLLLKDSLNWNRSQVEQLVKVIEEEKNHYNVMENVHDLIATYENYLTWREFDKVRASGFF